MKDYDELAREFLMKMDVSLWTNPPKNMVPILVIDEFVKFLKNTVDDPTDHC